MLCGALDSARCRGCYLQRPDAGLPRIACRMPCGCSRCVLRAIGPCLAGVGGAIDHRHAPVAARCGCSSCSRCGSRRDGRSVPRGIRGVPASAGRSPDVKKARPKEAAALREGAPQLRRPDAPVDASRTSVGGGRCCGTTTDSNSELGTGNGECGLAYANRRMTQQGAKKHSRSGESPVYRVRGSAARSRQQWTGKKGL